MVARPQFRGQSRSSKGLDEITATKNPEELSRRDGVAEYHGGWLIINSRPVDLIMLDWARGKRVVSDTDQGKYSCHYHTWHPHAYVDVMYWGEFASSKVLYTNSQEFLVLKRHAEKYPGKLKEAMIHSFLSEARFTSMLVEKSAKSNDVYYLGGQVFGQFQP